MGRYGAVLLMCLTGQASSPEPSRFGSLGRWLTTSAEIGDIANGIGNRPWLTLGHRSMMLGVANIDVFLQPDAKGAQVSRGRMLALIADDPPAAPRRSAWRVGQTKPYAYIASSGRQPFHIIDERDVDWPFAIEGDIDDATLLSLVPFIRAWPRLPGVPEGQIPRQVYAAPIAVVARRADTIIVALRTGERTGQRVTVVQENGRGQLLTSIRGSSDVTHCSRRALSVGRHRALAPHTREEPARAVTRPAGCANLTAVWRPA